MKKIVFILMLMVNTLFIYASGQTQAYPEIRITIENKTNKKVKFFFNKLYQPDDLEPAGSEAYTKAITLRTPVDYIENQGYFAIEFSDGHFELYTFFEHGSERRSMNIDIDYTVSVTEESVNISPGTVTKFPDYEVVGNYEGFYWKKEIWESMQAWLDSGNVVKLVLKNNTDKEVFGSSPDIYFSGEWSSDNGKELWVNDHSENIYEISDRIIFLHGRIRITGHFSYSSDWTTFEPIYLDMFERRRKRQLPSQIHITFNEESYEIQYIE